MAFRTIRIQGDPVLTKVCRPIPEVTDRHNSYTKTE